MSTDSQANQKKIFNPFDSISADAQQGESTSAICNTDVGICPKCKTQMSTAVLNDPVDTVFFCQSCRVSSPLPDMLG